MHLLLLINKDNHTMYTHTQTHTHTNTHSHAVLDHVHQARPQVTHVARAAAPHTSCSRSGLRFRGRRSRGRRRGLSLSLRPAGGGGGVREQSLPQKTPPRRTAPRDAASGHPQHGTRRGGCRAAAAAHERSAAVRPRPRTFSPVPGSARVSRQAAQQQRAPRARARAPT